MAPTSVATGMLNKPSTARTPTSRRSGSTRRLQDGPGPVGARVAGQGAAGRGLRLVPPPGSGVGEGEVGGCRRAGRRQALGVEPGPLGAAPVAGELAGQAEA